MGLWFSLIFKTILKAFLPVALLLVAYHYLCRRYGWPVKGQFIYYLVIVPVLIALLSSIGDLFTNLTYQQP